MSGVGLGWRNGGVTQSNKLNMDGHGGCCDRFFCGEVPIKIMPIKIIVLAEYNPSVLTAEKLAI